MSNDLKLELRTYKAVNLYILNACCYKLQQLLQDECEGLQLVGSHDEGFKLWLVFEHYRLPYHTVNYCPFCGTKINITTIESG